MHSIVKVVLSSTRMLLARLCGLFALFHVVSEVIMPLSFVPLFTGIVTNSNPRKIIAEMRKLKSLLMTAYS